MTEEYWDGEPDPTAIEKNPGKCRHPKYLRVLTMDGTKCGSCDHVFDPARQRTGRNNRKRGNKAELTSARLLGGRKMGPLGLPWDVELEGYMRLQIKKLVIWPSLEKVTSWMDAIPIGREMRAVALIEPGRGGRQLLVLDLAEFARWHGDPTKEARADGE